MYTIGHWLPKFLEQHNLKKILFHQLCYTNATILLKDMMDIKSVSRLLGLASVSTTGNIYVHLLQSENETATKKIGNILFNNNKSNIEKHALFLSKCINSIYSVPNLPPKCIIQIKKVK